MSAVAASVLTIEREPSPVLMSTVPTMNLISDCLFGSPSPAPANVLPRWTSKSVSGLIL